MIRSVRLIRNSGVRLGNFALGIGIAFFLMPFLVRNLGDRMYGIWTLVGSVLGYYGLIDIGLSSAVVRFISRAVGRAEKDEVRTVFCTSFYLFLVLGLITATLTWILMWALGSIIRSPQDLDLLRPLLLILGLNFALDFPVRAFNAVFTSNIRDDISVGISMVKSVIATALIVWAVNRGMGIMALAVISVSASAVDSMARIFFALRIEPAISINPKFINWSRVRPLFSYSAYSFVSRIGDILQFRIDSLVITAYVGLGAVTHYFVGGRLVEYLRDALSQSVRGMTPIFSQEEGRNNFESIRSKFLYVTKITCMMATFAVGCAIAYGHQFIEAWMGPRFLDAYPVLVALTVGMFFRMVQLPSVPLLYGISKHKYHAYATLVEGILNLILSVILVKKYGILGVALGTQIPMMIMTIFVQPWYVSRVTGLNVWVYARHTLRNVAVSWTAFAAGYVICRHIVAPSYLSLVICGVVQALIFWPLAFRFVLAKGERDHLFTAVQRAVSVNGEREPEPLIAAGSGK